MLLAADYPFLNILWTMIIFFAWVAWFWILITIFADLFRRHDIGGWGKAAWVVFLIVVPFLGVLVYLIAQHDGMRERCVKQAEAQQRRSTSTCATTAGGSAAEIEKAKQLLDSGAINQAEFDAIKAKAVG